MPTNRITMRQIRETLRLHLQAGLSYSEVGRALKISKSAVGKYVSWPACRRGLGGGQTLTTKNWRPGCTVRRCRAAATSDARLRPRPPGTQAPGVTLMLLWEEYATGNELAYKYTSFCVKYREFAKAQALDAPGPYRRREAVRRLRRRHRADRRRRHRRDHQAQIFVATLGASNYTYACATPRQTTADWIGRRCRRWSSSAACPADRARPDPRADQEPRPLRPRAQPHLRGVRPALRLRLLAARPAHPRDKPKVEGRCCWCSAGSWRGCATALLQPGRAQPGHRPAAGRPEPAPFKKLPGCRRSAFEQLDASRRCGRCRPKRFEICRWKTAKVNIDYHVEFEGHYYSVPHRWCGTTSNCASPATLLECFASNQRVACHALSHRARRLHHHAEHMPASHRAHLEWTPPSSSTGVSASA
jgi:hypothetical protein